jgi:transcriptional regulator with XRE-family HTH domain
MIPMATRTSNLRFGTEEILRCAIPATLSLTLALPGTGGHHSEHYLRLLDAKLYIDAPKKNGAGDFVPINVATAADDLARIKSILKLSTTDLAQTLGVSRQAVYNWKSGSHIKLDNLTKLANLKSAADVFVEARLTVLPEFLDRKLSSGKTFLEHIAGGAEGAGVAAALIKMLSEEASQRRTLDALLADNTPRLPDASDYGAPAFREG